MPNINNEMNMYCEVLDIELVGISRQNPLIFWNYNKNKYNLLHSLAL